MFTEERPWAHSGRGVKTTTRLPLLQGLRISKVHVKCHQNTPASLDLNHIYRQTEMSSMTCDLLMHIVRRMRNKYVLLLLPKVSRPAVGLTQPPIR